MLGSRSSQSFRQPPARLHRRRPGRSGPPRRSPDQSRRRTLPRRYTWLSRSSQSTVSAKPSPSWSTSGSPPSHPRRHRHRRRCRHRHRHHPRCRQVIPTESVVSCPSESMTVSEIVCAPSPSTPVVMVAMPSALRLSLHPEVMAIATPHTHERIDGILIVADARRETGHLAFVEHLVIEGIEDGDGGCLIVDRQSLLGRTGQTDEPECNKSDSHGVIPWFRMPTGALITRTDHAKSSQPSKSMVHPTSRRTSRRPNAWSARRPRRVPIHRHT